MKTLAVLLRRLADRIDPPRRGVPTADRGDDLTDWEDPATWGERPL